MEGWLEGEEEEGLTPVRQEFVFGGSEGDSEEELEEDEGSDEDEEPETPEDISEDDDEDIYVTGFKDLQHVAKKGRDRRFMSPEEKAEEKLKDALPGDKALAEFILKKVGANLFVYHLPTMVAAATWSRLLRSKDAPKDPKREFGQFCKSFKFGEDNPIIGVSPADTLRYYQIVA